MHRLVWRKIIVCILILVILTGVSGCRAGGQAEKSIKNFMDGLGNVPNRLVVIINNLLDSIANIGGAVIDQFQDTIGRMLGR